MLIETAYTEFITACLVDGLSKSTIKWYGYHVGRFVIRFAGVDLAAITAHQVRVHLLESRGVSVATMRGKFRALRRFFNWSIREYRLPLEWNPLLNIRQPRADKPLPKAIAREDIRRLLAVCGDDQRGKRDRAIIATLADTGCRAGGLLALRSDDVDLERRVLTLTEKGSRTRRVPFGQFTSMAIRAWLEVRPEQSTTLFCALKEHVWAQPLTISGLTLLLKRRKRQAGITGRCNPHAFRHAFARDMIQAGADSAIVSKLMGHSSIKVTVDTYAVFNEAELSAQHERYSPLRDLEQWTLAGQKKVTSNEVRKAVIQMNPERLELSTNGLKASRSTPYKPFPLRRVAA